MSIGLSVAELWRYPVKSLRGEQIADAAVGIDGVVGDRRVHVAGARGLLTGRTRYGLLTLDASTGPDGVPHVAGHRWDSAEAAAAVRAAAGPDARLVADSTAERFDVLPLLVLTQAEADAVDVEVRRLRPNVVIAGAGVGDERDWPGLALRIGAAVIGVHSLRPRCVVTTIDPDTGAQDLDVLRRIRRERDGALALNCWTVRPGRVCIGDPVEVIALPKPLPADGRPAPGGWVTGADYPHRAETA